MTSSAKLPRFEDCRCPCHLPGVSMIHSTPCCDSLTVPLPVSLTLRDWFAGQALVGMGAWGPAPHNWYGEAQLRAKAKYAYEIADAMLKARDATDADH